MTQETVNLVARLVFVPGLGNSGPEHWQTWWEAQEHDATRVVQFDWETPDLDAWSARILMELDRVQQPTWLVAHSFGCLASLHAAVRRPHHLLGLWLVAPANPVRLGVDPQALSLAVPMPSMVVASSNDPWLPVDQARQWSRRWGSDFINLGEAGHINVASGHGPWPQGQRLFLEWQILAKSRRGSSNSESGDTSDGIPPHLATI